MPFNPFSTLTGKNATTLFEIRLDDDFIIFRGNEHEAAGQLLKGVVVLCLPSSLKVEDIHLRLTGTLRLAWTDCKTTPSGISTTRVDRTRVVLNHRWDPFVGPPAGSSSRSVTLPAGNYEWPFELLLPGTTAESVEGLPETSLTYKLKATIARGKLAYDLHAHKHLRIVRTLEPAALEFLHAMSVENVWVNKIEYSIAMPQKAVVLGGTIPLEMRFTPLLKGLEMGDISVKLVEIQDFMAQCPVGVTLKEHRHEREVSRWTLTVNREEHWQDVMEETEQEGWVVKAPLELPKRLRECVQDVNMHGIRVRHKLRLNIALRNPDGHVSELRATLPVTIFISPNMLLDDQGNLVRQTASAVSAEDIAAVAPPGYGEHILDQLYENVDVGGFQSPPLQSGVNSPFYSQSRTGSTDNLPPPLGGAHVGVAPAALTSRLQNVVSPNNSTVAASSFDQSNRNSFNYADSAHLSYRTGGEDDDSTHSSGTTRVGIPSGMTSGHHTPEHIDFPLEELSRVPSYATAVKAPARTLHIVAGNAPPDYRVVVSASAPSSPGRRESDPMVAAAAGQMETIHEVATAASNNRRRRGSGSSGRSGHSNRSTGRERAATAPGDRPQAASLGRGRTSSLGIGFLHSYLHTSDSDERRRLHLIQARESVI